MAKGLVIRPESCIHCQSCALACSYRRTGAYSLQSAAVAVWQAPGAAFAVPLMCMHCEEPACVPVCPTGALHRDEKLGAVLLDAEKCIRCGQCTAACTLGNVRRDRLHGCMVKCDLCGGHPQCAEVCPAGAISFVELDGAAASN